MGSFQHPRSFQPLELEIIDYVYEAAWAQLEARDPFRDRDQDWVRQAVLRRQIIDCAGPERSSSTPCMKKCWELCPNTGPLSLL